MHRQLFVSQKGRSIEVVIDTHISFQFPNEGGREFYWVDKDDWDDHWRVHMVQKTWYSPAMAEFIDKHTKDGNSKKH